MFCATLSMMVVAVSNPEEALFDTWQQGRKQGMSAGIRYEQERIIKLLEDPMTLNRWWGKPEVSLGLYGNLAKYVIGLIKGEK